MLDKLIDGMKKAADIIVSTFGPMGKKVFIGENADRGWTDRFTRDGITVARHVVPFFQDKAEQAGARLLVDVATKMHKRVGDGTTSVCALVWALIEYRVSSITANSLKSWASWCVARIEEEAKKYPVTLEILRSLAITAANNRADIGTMIAELVYKLGKDSFVKAQVSTTGQTHTDIVLGYHIEGGAFIPQFLGGQVARYLHKPFLLIIDEKLSDYKKLLPVYDAYKKEAGDSGRPLVIIASDIEGDALRFILTNLISPQQGGKPVPVFVIRAPESTNAFRRYTMLCDIAECVGCDHYSGYRGSSFSMFKTVHKKFGECEAIEITGTDARLMFSKDKDAHIIEYAGSIQDPDEEFLKQRRAKMTTGVGVIHIGGYSESEFNYLNDVIEDCVLATQSAMKHGVVPGGAYMTSLLANEMPEEFTDYISALNAIENCLLYNAGLSEDGSQFKEGFVFDILQAKHIPVAESPIFDAAMVHIASVQNAASLLSEVFDTEQTIIL